MLTLIWDNLNSLVLTACALVSTITPIMLAMINRAQKKAAHKAAVRVEEVRTNLARQQKGVDEKLEKIHQAVNGERSAMLLRIQEMQSEILKLTADKK